MLQGLSLPASSNSSRKTTTEALLARLLLFPFMSDQESSDDQLALQLMSPPDPAGRGLGRGPSTGTYPLKTVVRQQQDNAKTCRLLALEVGSLKAELTREQKKRAQAVRRATAAEAAHRHAEQRLNELLYSNSKLQQELTAAKEAAESSSRRVHSLRQSLADAEAEAQEKRVLGQQQVGLAGTCLGGSARHLRAAAGQGVCCQAASWCSGQVAHNSPACVSTQPLREPGHSCSVCATRFSSWRCWPARCKRWSLPAAATQPAPAAPPARAHTLQRS